MHTKTDQVLGGEPQYFAAQRMAAAAGFAYLDETVHLSTHPVYGAWYSLRAILVYDDVPFTGPRPTALPCTIDPAAHAAAVVAFNKALQVTLGALAQ